MYPRVLTIQDISCVGQCSTTVALPILSACGAETCILPTVLLSTHDPQHALRFSQKVLALSGGQVAADGCTADVLTPELLRRLYGVEAVVLDTPCGRVLLPGEEGGSCV